MLATTAAEIEAAHKRGKFAALMGIEGGHAIEDSLRLLRDYYALGRSLHDADPFQHQQLGGFVGRHDEGRRHSITTG